MARDDIYSALMKAFQNPTKLSIILLLSEGRKLTVTQMSKSVKVTRANLYHFVKEMVDEGLILGPEIKATRNFVEKYYSLNDETFRFVDPLEVERRLRNGNVDELIVMLRSFLASLSLQFHILAEEIARADEARVKELVAAFRDQRVLLHYSMISDEAYRYELREYEKIIRKSIARWGKEPLPEPKNRLIMVGLPAFRDQE